MITIPQIAEEDTVDPLVDQSLELQPKAHELRWTAVDDEDAVLNALPLPLQRDGHSIPTGILNDA
jgi:hypothetical protein